MKIATIILLCFASSCFQIAGTSFIKIAINQSPIVSVKDYLPFLLQPKVIMALSFVFIAALIMFKALSFGSLSLVTPIFTAINFLFTIIAGKFLFDESMGLAKISGLIIIVIGVVLVANSESTI
jgi:multidrug transporter EmrE-like cation transporter